MTNPTPREIQLVEAALKAAAEKCEDLDAFDEDDPGKSCAKTIRSLDRAAIVASVPVPVEQPDESEALSMAVIEHIGPAALAGDKISILDAFELGWKARAALSAQEHVEPTDVEIGELILKHLAGSSRRLFLNGDHINLCAGSLITICRALLSANQGKK